MTSNDRKEQFMKVLNRLNEVFIETAEELNLDANNFFIGIIDGQLRATAMFRVRKEALLSEEELRAQNTDEEFERLIGALGSVFDEPVDDKTRQQADKAREDLKGFFE